MEAIENKVNKIPRALDNEPLFKGVKRLALRPMTKDEYQLERPKPPTLGRDMWENKKALDVLEMSAYRREIDENGDSKIIYAYTLSDGNRYREDWLVKPDFSIGGFTKLMRGSLGDSGKKK